MKIAIAFFAFLALAAASAQTIKLTTPAESDVVTISLAYWNSDPDFAVTECFWYVPQPKNHLLLVHTGCASFTREYGAGSHQMLLVSNGRKKGETAQLSQLATIVVRSRFDITLTSTGNPRPQSDTIP
jgi:hypothetical protein